MDGIDEALNCGCMELHDQLSQLLVSLDNVNDSGSDGSTLKALVLNAKQPLEEKLVHCH